MKDKLKKYLLPNLPYLFFVYLFDKLCQAVRLVPGLDASEKLLHIGQGFQTAFASSAPSFHALDICIGILGAILVRLAVYVKGKNAKKYRKGIEYGSARWGTAADIAPYIDPVPDWNIPLTRTESLTMTSRPKDPKTARNKNILVIGGSGSGKTQFFVKPSIMQMHSSYVITDPKGQLLKETGKMLLHGAPKLDENGKPVRDSRGKVIYEPYRIKVLNTINFSKSMKYNPLAYVRSEKDILKLVNVIIANTKGDGEKSSEDFWVKAERLLYCALIGYIWYEAEPEERNFITLLDLLNACEAREDDETYKSPVDILFDDLAKKQPEHFAVKQYVKFKMAAGKTLKSILVSCGARLAPFDIKELRDIMTEDELELDTMGDRKTALFLIMSDTDTTFNFVIAMLQSQLFNLLCDKADDFYNGRLPVHVRCLLDEFANIGQIPNFDKLIATIRSREISVSIILQSQSQLKTIYKDAADTIVGNCDSTLFLGGKEKGTLKEISELLGKETIDSLNQSENRGAQTSHGLSYQKLGKELMTQDEIAVMDGGKCILQLRGVRPFFSDKYDLTKHPRYKYLSDADKKNVFDVERYMKHRPAIVKPDEPFDMYELSAKDLTDEPDNNNSTKRKEI
ncbi:VirD4-like conjugal transfer protein, CD1115 family [Dysosmobacter sp.]|uniref:VirD4-like conjugal transfer protein, CD1115 family n=1 Tax=Dysosmobacter sp. TaxID=2591382 RepID=UPI003AB545AC